jgi:hypothetical protein
VVFCFLPEFFHEKRELFRSGSSINTICCCEESGSLVLSDLSDDLFCLNPSTGEERWRTTIPDGIWSTTIWAHEQAVFVSSKDARWLSLGNGKTLKKVDLGEGVDVSMAAECGQGVIVWRRGAFFYLENFSKAGTKMSPIPGSVRFAAKSGENCIAADFLKHPDDNEPEISFFEITSGALLEEKCVPNCSEIHQLRTLTAGGAIIVGQVAGTDNSGAWLVKNTTMEQIWQSTNSRIIDVSKNGKWGLFQSGETEIICPSDNNSDNQ